MERGTVRSVSRAVPTAGSCDINACTRRAMLGIVYLVVLYMQERAREKRKQREREQEPEGEPLLVCPVRDLLSTHSDWLRM